jgi:hypothetical protein
VYGRTVRCAAAVLGSLVIVGGSLNPAREPPLSDRIVQLHHAGGRDGVPAEIVWRGVRGRARLVVMPGHDHVCCWESA